MEKEGSFKRKYQQQLKMTWLSSVKAVIKRHAAGALYLGRVCLSIKLANKWMHLFKSKNSTLSISRFMLM